MIAAEQLLQLGPGSTPPPPPPKPLSLVFPLKEGGRPDDNIELRWCLRSIEKHLRIPVGEVFVFGHRPRWLSGDVHHIPMRDQGDKAMNLRAKYDRMVNTDAISSPFLLLDDDHIFMAETTEIPLHTWGDFLPFLTQFGKQTQAVYMRAAYDALVARGLPTRNYQVHYPLLIHKPVLAEAVSMMTKPAVMGSIYGNLIGGPSVEITADFKLNTTDDFRRLRASPFISVSDRGLARLGVRAFFTAAFPQKSRWEAPANRSEMRAMARRAAGLPPKPARIPLRRAIREPLRVRAG